ncbi:hypothetical protein GQ43DRAFT_241141 [Delitschia confertaspora ATCC 74209]|uniref:RGS domain-containing protein n=1 Tax=Delitschia confertaspora ATCC 74209 TaxID=1513339 RepID=A0A9P4JCE8_9PLEO|nr:hypothetical protein GQ43DRAFT_241141 [Delitschia confertaspora ATCC 74209]
MTPVLSPRLIDGGRPNLNALGISYIVLAVVYTLVISGELYLLYLRRSAFCVHIRNVKVVVSSVLMLQVYLILVLLVYPENGAFPCSTEYWIMSIFLPSGMALFQACNARVLKAYESQRRLRTNYLELARKKKVMMTPRGLYEGWLDLDAAAKVYVGTVVALIITFIPTLLMFFGSRRFHASYGFFGPAVGARECRQGVEWIPSIIIQLLWTAVVGPWILWKIRNVHDVHGWAWQTRLAIIAGLPGTPLWIAFTYAKASSMISVNKHFATAGWFIPSLVVCQQVLIVIPLWGAFKSRPRRSSFVSITTTETLTSHSLSLSGKSPTVSSGSRELKPKASMCALEFAIQHNIEPLIAWAASREFTAENAIFLREVRNFKKKWSGLTTVTTSQRKQMFTEASLIFFTLVNPFTAETPINIEYKIFRCLQNTFATVEYDPYRPTSRSGSPDSVSARENVVCPWEDASDRPASLKSEVSVATTKSLNIVPSEFSEDVFDRAFDSIKYLVFTNTWPRYVEAELLGDVSC